MAYRREVNVLMYLNFIVNFVGFVCVLLLTKLDGTRYRALIAFPKG